MRNLLLSSIFAIVAACGGKSTAPATTGGETGPGSAEPAPGGACATSGCSSTVCTEPGNEMVTTCEFKAEYACYQKATCARQSDGKCGWTESAELQACLANPPPM
ncbi:MAG: hypothetical protein H0T89_25870 [Deltaproteobacteria bacterium]|nr:hypothetical protein [Deltaproteobacteria bacterium]MDQ3301211.1 hypothetical protein [Myxococcota bacterium]